MSNFVIQPHGRLQEWIAHENGYFREEGLDYGFVPGPSHYSTKRVNESGKVQDVIAGAFESYREGGGNKGVKSDISCACHWTVNQAAAEHIGTMWGKAYVVTPGAIMVPPDSPITKPEDLANQEVAVGYRSGSHYTTIQALEAFLPPEQIKLRFVGSQWARVDIGLDRDVPATSVWGLTYLVLDQLGFRKIADCSFMIAFMFPPSAAREDVEKYMNGLKRAQMELDLAPEKYKQYYLNEIPERYRDRVDVRRFSPGERIVFLPYSEATFARTQAWIHERDIFPEPPAELNYASSVAA